MGLEGVAGSQFPGPVGRWSDSENTAVEKKVNPYQKTPKYSLKFMHTQSLLTPPSFPSQASSSPPPRASQLLWLSS